ncbi:hypothetical protein Tco_1109400 [Tanacetum coccineum]
MLAQSFLMKTKLFVFLNLFCKPIFLLILRAKEFVEIVIARVMEDRLVGNLCTIWIGRFHLHANVARYSSESAKILGKTIGAFINPCAWYIWVIAFLLAWDFPPLIALLLMFLPPSAFGGLWVLIELDNEGSKQKFLDHVGVNSWFCTLLNAYNDFVSDERVVWVDIEGIPLHVWSRETFANLGNNGVKERERDRKPWRLELLMMEGRISDVESDDECICGWVSESVFCDNMDEGIVDGLGKETGQTTIKGSFGFYDLLDKLPAKGVRVCEYLFYPHTTCWKESRLLGRSTQPPVKMSKLDCFLVMEAKKERQLTPRSSLRLNFAKAYEFGLVGIILWDFFQHLVLGRIICCRWIRGTIPSSILHSMASYLDNGSPTSAVPICLLRVENKFSTFVCLSIGLRRNCGGNKMGGSSSRVSAFFSSGRGVDGSCSGRAVG